MHGVWRGLREPSGADTERRSRNTVRSYVVPLRTLCTYLVAKGVLKRDPFAEAGRRSGDRRNSLLSTRRSRLCAPGVRGRTRLDLRDRALLIVAWTTGLRLTRAVYVQYSMNIVHMFSPVTEYTTFTTERTSGTCSVSVMNAKKRSNKGGAMMLKREILWRQLADDVLDGRRTTFHQRDLAVELGMSAGNVNLALEPLRAVGAVAVVGKNLVVRDVKKILMLWGARRLPQPVTAAFVTPERARDVLHVLPPGLALTSFAGFVERYGDEPAPFTVVRAYVRADDARTLAELGRRFASALDKRTATIAIHAADAVLARDLPGIVGPAQLFVDLWSEADFFASDYLRALEGRLSI